MGVAVIALVCAGGCKQSKTGPQTYTRQYSTPTTVNGLPVVGRVEFYTANNGLRFARIASDTVMWGQSLPAGTGIHFTPDGKPVWCFLAKNHGVQGHLFRGGGHEWMTCFYPSGRLKSGGLVNVETIDGIPCDVGSFWNEASGGGGRTYFYEDGKLKSAKVAQATTYRGQTIEKGRHVQLAPDGSIESIR